MPAKDQSNAARATQTKAEDTKAQTGKAVTGKANAPNADQAAAQEAAEASREANDEALAITREAAARGASWQEEALRFMSMRMERQMDHLGALVACRTPVDLLEVESRFAVQSVQDYLDESYRMMERVADFGSGAIGAWPGRKPGLSA